MPPGSTYFWASRRAGAGVGPGRQGPQGGEQQRRACPWRPPAPCCHQGQRSRHEVRTLSMCDGYPMDACEKRQTSQGRDVGLVLAVQLIFWQ
jgi:hypothetical protein